MKLARVRWKSDPDLSFDACRIEGGEPGGVTLCGVYVGGYRPGTILVVVGGVIEQFNSADLMFAKGLEWDTSFPERTP